MKTVPKKKSLWLLLLAVLIVLAFGLAPSPSLADKVITIAEGVGPQTLDPQKSTVQAVNNIAFSICEPLTYVDYSTGAPKVIPCLAESWKLIEDTVWEIKLRKGVKFANGDDFDAAAAKYSIDRINDPATKSPARLAAREIKEVKIIDSHTIHLITDGPVPAMPLNMQNMSIVPPKYVEEKGVVEFSKNPIGTGPFVLSKWVKDEYVELKAKDDYWGSRSKLDRVIYKSIPEINTRMAALKNGEADLVSNVLIEDIPSIEKTKGLKVSKVPSLRMMFIQFDLEKENSPVADVRVRLAMNHAVDVESIVKNIMQGYAIPLKGQPLSPEYIGHSPNLKPYTHDPEKARKLIKEAGYDNYQFEIIGPTGRYVRGKEVTEVVAAQLTAAGIKTKARILEWGKWLDLLLSKKLFPMSFWGAATAANAAVWYNGMLVPGAPYSVNNNPKFMPLFKKAAGCLDPVEAQKRWDELNQLLHDDPPLIYLYQQMNIYGVNDRVGGWVPQASDRIDFYHMYVK